MQATEAFQPTAPYHAVYYHPVYGTPAVDGEWQGWDAAGAPPLTWASHYLPDRFAAAFDPASELYSVRDPATFYWQLDGMATAKIEVAISDWHGIGHPTDLAFAQIVQDLMARPENPYPNLRWVLHYRAEAQSDPGSAVLISELDYLAAHYAGEAAYLQIDGRPVLFVDAAPDDGEELVRRWTRANAQAQTRFHLVLRTVPEAADFELQPDSWHSPAGAAHSLSQPPDFFTVSPGYWPYDHDDPALARDVHAFRVAVEEMAASDVRWRIVASWNQWQEGTAVEPGDPVIYDPDSGRAVFDRAAPRFQNIYLRVLAETLPPLEDGAGEAPTPGDGHVPTGPGTTVPTTAFEFAAGGDHSFSPQADATLTALGQSEAEFYIALGDLSYSTTGQEQEWCDFVTDRVGETFPFQLLAGNHEDQPEDGAFIGAFAECLPSRLKIHGIYAHRYYFDYPQDNPLARFILIDPDLYRDGALMNYCRNGDVANCRWLHRQIQDAKEEGLWVVVAVHKTCISVGTKSCEIGEELFDVLISAGVDLILHGHEHHYARSHQLNHSSLCPGIPVNEFNPACIASSPADGTFQRGRGTLLVVNGAMGTHLRDVFPDDPESPYYATWMGKNVQPSFGYVRLGISPCRLQGEFSAVVGGYTDTFSIVDQPPGDHVCPLIWTPSTVQGVTSATGEIRPEAAGKLTVTDPVTVTAVFPPGAVSEPVTVRLMTTPAEPSADHAAHLDTRWELTDLHFALDTIDDGGVALDSFSDAVALQIAYDDGDLSGQDAPSPAVALYSDAESKWIVQPTRIDAGSGTLMSKAHEPGLYAVLDRRSRSPAADGWIVYLPYLLKW